jgi:hypothetical protein
MPAKKRSTKTDSTATPVAPAVSPQSVSLAAAEGKVEAPKVKKSAAKKVAKGVEAAATTVSAKSAAPKAVKSSTSTSAKSSTSIRIVTEDEIRQRAFYLSLQRHGSHDPIADWLEAERSLRSQTA